MANHPANGLLILWLRQVDTWGVASARIACLSGDCSQASRKAGLSKRTSVVQYGTSGDRGAWTRVPIYPGKRAVPADTFGPTPKRLFLPRLHNRRDDLRDSRRGVIIRRRLIGVWSLAVAFQGCEACQERSARLVLDPSGQRFGRAEPLDDLPFGRAGESRDDLEADKVMGMPRRPG